MWCEVIHLSKVGTKGGASPPEPANHQLEVAPMVTEVPCIPAVLLLCQASFPGRPTARITEAILLSLGSSRVGPLPILNQNENIRNRESHIAPRLFDH